MSVRAMARSQSRDVLLQKASRFLSRMFVSMRVIPLVPEIANANSTPTWLGGIVRAKGTGRITLRYDFDKDVTIYAKAYTDVLGLQTYKALRVLWLDGFGRGAPFRVPEPLGFINDDNFLLLRRADGVPLTQILFAKDSKDSVIKAARRAAQWLAKLHSSTVPCLNVEPPCERIKIFKLGDMLAKAAAAYPEQAPWLLDLLQKIRRLAPAESTPLQLTPTHGQFTPANIFVRGDEVSVIDLDRICLSDPAKDVAMFVHRIRSLMFKDAGDSAKAESIAREFVDEYRRLAPENLRNLPFYTALYSLKGFAKIAKDRGPNDPLRRPLELFYLSTIERCFGSGETWSLLTAPALGNGKPNRGSKEDLGTWACEFKESDFIGKFVRPNISPESLTAEGAIPCKTTIVQNTGTGRLTLRYDFDSGVTLYAKLYTDELGAYSYQVLKALWDGGFNHHSRFRVSEPLAFLAEHNLVLIGAAKGEPLVKALNGEGPFDLVEGCRIAARWLAAFHRSSIRVGEPEPDWDSLKIFRICVRLTKAAAARPEERDALLDLMHGLKARIKTLPDQKLVTQTHGRYHHDHIFIDGNNVSVIDLDRSRPTHPAKDVAEFLRVLRMSAFRSHPNMKRADHATQAFLNEYLSKMPEVAASLPYYWSAFLWLSLFGFVKKLEAHDPRRQALMDFHLREMERAMEIKL